jgi:hypothetical protein
MAVDVLLRGGNMETALVQHHRTNGEDIVLPPEAAILGPQLITIARNFLGARRRHGLALLEASRCLCEARALADEGKWHVFLSVIGTSPDVAERLLNIAVRADGNASFAEALMTGRLNQTVAGLLARPSTPPHVISQVLANTPVPRVVDVYQALRDATTGDVENPHYADSPMLPQSPSTSLPIWLTPVCEELARARVALLSAHGDMHTLNARGIAMLTSEITHMRTALERIERTLQCNDNKGAEVHLHR